MGKYVLSEDFMLCGWEKNECGLLRVCDKTVKFLPTNEFKFLMLCNGKVDVDQIPFVTPSIIEKYYNKNIIEHLNETNNRNSIMYKKYKNRYVKSAQWSITGKCNFKCRHCFLDAPIERIPSLSFNEIEKILDMLVECGIFHLKITGGEPLIRNDFWDIVDHAQNNGIVIDEIYTNGYLVNEEFIDNFKRRNLIARLNISFDGIDGWHEWMRRVPNSEIQTLRAFEICKENNIRTAAEMVLHKGNKEALRSTINTLSKYGVEKLKVGPLFDTDLWLKNCDQYYMSMDEYYDTCIDYLQYYYEDNKPLSLFLGYIYSYSKDNMQYMIPSDMKAKSLDDFTCLTARNNIYISPDGRLLPCMASTSLKEEYLEFFPSLLKKEMIEILQDSEYLSFIDMRLLELYEQNQTCYDCNNKMFCKGGCRIQAMAFHNGNKFECDDILCNFYKKEYRNKVIEMIEKLENHYENKS